ncbi:MAG: amidohydrolase [Chitinophagaceae bacterium]|nr:amidohydrolase [Chitinophagaceae bacterium]
MNSYLLFLYIILSLSCASKTKIDILVYDAIIYTVDSSFSVVEAMAIKDGKILATGTSARLLQQFDAKEKLDAKGKYIYPGFIDAHAHFFEYGLGLQTVDLTGTRGWEECVERIIKFIAKDSVTKSRYSQKGSWIIGRGWDQNDWIKKDFPDKEALDLLFKNIPILLTRIDGHAAIANQAALDLAGIGSDTKLTGGDVELKNGKPTGILIDNAIELVTSEIPRNSEKQTEEALMAAQRNCFAVGLTTIDDCGLNRPDVELLEKLQKNGALKMRLYVMLSDHPSNYQFLFNRGKIKTDRLHVRSFKVYADGALGSRGACLLKPYSDKPAQSGFLLSNKEHFDSVATIIYEKGFQMCTHAIGDSGNRVVLNTYGSYLKGQNDRRWRIEHAQVVDSADFPLFGRYSIIPSVQPTHATSDMYWAIDRLGREREKGAYAYNDLLKQNGWIALGTDFPVEDISPFKTFYAAVVRKDAAGWPNNGYQVENALNAENAIRGMTIWAAKSNFEEHEKGSLENGKFADFIILDKDILKTAGADILTIQVLKTYVNGETVYEKY